MFLCTKNDSQYYLFSFTCTREMLYLVFDIETTGQFVGKDACFAIGYVLVQERQNNSNYCKML